MQIQEDRLYLHVGERLKRRREEKRITQAMLSQRSGVDRSSIANIEGGRQRPSLHVLYKLCAALEIEVSAILPSNVEVVSQRAADDRALQGGNLPPKAAQHVETLMRELEDER
jgi:transcriptional regulator with XRE-family HTH domain